MITDNRELKQWRQWWQREGLKRIRFRLAKHLCTCTVFVYISWHEYDVKPPNFTFFGGFKLLFSSSAFWYSPLWFNSRKIHEHLTNWTRLNNSKEVCNTKDSLFEWSFRFHCCPGCFKSSLISSRVFAQFRNFRCIGACVSAIKVFRVALFFWVHVFPDFLHSFLMVKTIFFWGMYSTWLRLSVLVDFVTQALQMLKEHPTYRDDEEIRGMQKHTCIYSLE